MIWNQPCLGEANAAKHKQKVAFAAKPARCNYCLTRLQKSMKIIEEPSCLALLAAQKEFNQWKQQRHRDLKNTCQTLFLACESPVHSRFLFSCGKAGKPALRCLLSKKLFPMFPLSGLLPI